MRTMRMWSLIAIAAVIGLSGLPTVLAAQTDYIVPAGQTLGFFISGGEPSLSNQNPSETSAGIAEFDDDMVWVECFLVTGTCTGKINR